MPGPGRDRRGSRYRAIDGNWSMIGRALLIWSSAIICAINVPRLVDVHVPAAPRDGEKAEVIDTSVADGRYYVLRANEAGHFEGRFRFNGKPLQAMVDTGATFVTMSEADARSLGYGGNELRFRYEVMTANGKVKAARVVLKSIEIGTVQVRNVDAMVIRGKALRQPLVGMSFMRKLSSYSAEHGELKLFN
jgi:aspartyl protease family protein